MTKINKTNTNNIAVFSIDVEAYKEAKATLKESSEGRKAEIMKLYSENVLVPLKKQLTDESKTLEDIVNEFQTNITQVILSSKFRSFDAENEYMAFIGEQFMKIYGNFLDKTRAHYH